MKISFIHNWMTKKSGEQFASMEKNKMTIFKELKAMDPEVKYTPEKYTTSLCPLHLDAIPKVDKYTN